MVFSKAFHDTFDGRAARTLFFIIVGSALSYGVVRLWLGPGEAMLEIPYIVAGVVGAVGPLTLLFLWNLACAPYRVEKEAHAQTKTYLSDLEDKSPKPIDWSVWRNRDQYTLKEAASIMAGQEPSDEGLRAAPYAYAQELRWAIQNRQLETEIPTSIETSRRVARALGNDPEVPSSERICATVFKSWLSSSGHRSAPETLAKLNEVDQPK